jgi:hypothetical protein
MSEAKSRLTLPEIMRALEEKRATVERVVVQYGERIGPPERAGIVRTWPAEVVDQLRAILSEEERLREVRR